MARCICRVAVAMSERFVGPLTRGEGEFPRLVSFVFELAGRPERIVMEKARGAGETGAKDRIGSRCRRAPLGCGLTGNSPPTTPSVSVSAYSPRTSS